MPRNGIVGWCAKCVFNFIRNCQNILDFYLVLIILVLFVIILILQLKIMRYRERKSLAPGRRAWSGRVKVCVMPVSFEWQLCELRALPKLICYQGPQEWTCLMAALSIGLEEDEVRGLNLHAQNQTMIWVIFSILYADCLRIVNSLYIVEALGQHSPMEIQCKSCV